MKGVLKICSKFTGDYAFQSVILIKLQDNFTEITHRHGCSPVHLQHIFRTPFHKNTYGRLLLPFANLWTHDIISWYLVDKGTHQRFSYIVTNSLKKELKKIIQDFYFFLFLEKSEKYLRQSQQNWILTTVLV